MIRIFRNKRGSAEYIGFAVLLLVVIMLILLVMNLFSIITAKRQLDTCADQLTRQIQLAGKVNSDTDKLFESMCGNLDSLSDISYSVNAEYTNGYIQLGVPFTVTVTAKTYFGGFGELLKFPITLTSRSAGISESYVKIY